MRRIDHEARTLLLHRRQAIHRDRPESGELEVAVSEIAQIDEALGRIAQGSYGTCLACGGPLGLQRIRAIPEARYCLGCSGQRLGDG